MRLVRHRHAAAVVMAVLLLATSLTSGCAQPTATPLPPVTAIKPAAAATAAPTAQLASPPTAVQSQPPAAYQGPQQPASAKPAATYNPYPEPTIPAAPVASRASFGVTILHVNDVYGEIDPCG